MNQTIEVLRDTESPLPLLTLDEPSETPIQQDPGKLGGQPTIGGKRVPAETLINYLLSDGSVGEFLEDYDAVTTEEALAVLRVVRQAIRDGLLTNLRVQDEDSF